MLDLQPANSISTIKKKTCTYLNKTFKTLLLRFPKIDKYDMNKEYFRVEGQIVNSESKGNHQGKVVIKEGHILTFSKLLPP